jgi:CubicO group peptidase (beta-lactamase class C family)
MPVLAVVRTIVYLVSVSTLLISGSWAQGPVPVAEKLRQAAAGWDRHAREDHVPSFTVEVVNHAGVIFRHSYGGRDCKARKTPDANTIYYIASDTKPFTATAVMKLVEQKKIDLDAPVKRYLPRFELADPEATRVVTVRDLLSHRQGLDSMPIEIAEAFTGQMDDDKFYRLLKQVKPRGKFRYSNLHYTLLGRIVEAVSGQNWASDLEQNVLVPARMMRTVTKATAIRSDANGACALEEDGESWRPAMIQKTDRTMHAAGGIGSSADDLGRFLQMQLNDGVIGGKRILSPESMKQMHSPQSEVGSTFFTFERKSYGLGWYIGAYRGNQLVHHFGGFSGARAHLSFMPEHDIGVVVLQNADEPAYYFLDAVASDVYDIVLYQPMGEQWTKAEEAEAKSRTKAAARWEGFRSASANDLKMNAAGELHNADWGTLSIAQKGDPMLAHIGDLPIPLYVNIKTGELVAEIIGEKFSVVLEENAITFVKGETLRLRFVGEK